VLQAIDIGAKFRAGTEFTESTTFGLLLFFGVLFGNVFSLPEGLAREPPHILTTSIFFQFDVKNIPDAFEHVPDLF